METNKFLQIINNAVLLNSQRVNNTGLVSGTMGICLFMYEYARLIKCSRYEEVADMFLDEVMDNMNQCSHADFYSGTPGIGWGVNYLLAHGFAESEDEDMMEEMNETVKQEIFKLSQSESPSIPSLFPHLYFKEKKEVYPLLLDSLSRILTKETYFPPSALLCATYLLNKINSEQSIPVSVWDNLDRQIEKLKYQTQTERMMLQTLRKKSLTDLAVTCKKPGELGELAYQALLYDFKISLAFDETTFEKYLQELLSNSNEQDYLLNGLSGIGLVLLKGICTYEKR